MQYTTVTEATHEYYQNISKRKMYDRKVMNINTKIKGKIKTNKSNGQTKKTGKETQRKDPQ